MTLLRSYLKNRRRPVIRGMGRIFDRAGLLKVELPPAKNSYEAAAHALAEDWLVVGRDMRVVMHRKSTSCLPNQKKKVVK